MDTFASLALATEPPNPSLLLRKPINRDDYMISNVQYYFYIYLENIKNRKCLNTLLVKQFIN